MTVTYCLLFIRILSAVTLDNVHCGFRKLSVDSVSRVFVSAIGAIPSPFDCFLVNRGLKTLPVRMKEHQTSGLAVARWLEGNPRVTRVLHPGEQLSPG